jgi:pimeloyl-ACP methyl ester carboxylesterase
MTNIISIITLFLSVTKASAQSIPQDYFKGNKDSLLIEATKLINMPEPTIKNLQPMNFDPEVFKNMDFEQVYKADQQYFNTRDNKKIFAYKFPKKSDYYVILNHGLKSTGYLYIKTAELLREVTQAEVFAVGLRGHGKSDGKNDDVDYINQYAFAIQKVSLTEADIIDSLMKIHIARIIGLKMFNEIGNHSHDRLPVLFFNLHDNIPSRKYFYRANMSMAPEDYKEGLKSVQAPMLVLIVSRDEAFNAEAMKKAVTENSQANIQIIEGATHNSIRHTPKAYDLIKKWFSAL